MRNFRKLIESALASQVDEASALSQGAETPRDADGRLQHGDVSYDVKSTKGVPSKVTANLGSHTSAMFTKMAQKVQEAKSLAEELKSLEEDIKAEARDLIGDLFAPADEAMTRVVETISFSIELKRAAKNVETVKYASVLEEFTEHLTPELIKVLSSLKAKYTSVNDKAGALSISAKVESVQMTEGVFDKFAGFFAKLKETIASWGTSYDAKLDSLRAQLHGMGESAGGPGYVNQDGSNVSEQ